MSPFFDSTIRTRQLLLPKVLTALQRVGLVVVRTLEARDLLAEPVHQAELAFLEVRALEAPVRKEDAPARARMVVSLGLAWANTLR